MTADPQERGGATGEEIRKGLPKQCREDLSLIDMIESLRAQLAACETDLSNASRQRDRAQEHADYFEAQLAERDALITRLQDVEIVSLEQEVVAHVDTIERLQAQIEAMREVIRKHYPTIAGRVIQLQNAGEDRAAAEWDAVARDFYGAALDQAQPPAVLPETGWQESVPKRAPGRPRTRPPKPPPMTLDESFTRQ